jgi:hypothetical protein
MSSAQTLQSILASLQSTYGPETFSAAMAALSAPPSVAAKAPEQSKKVKIQKKSKEPTEAPPSDSASSPEKAPRTQSATQKAWTAFVAEQGSTEAFSSWKSAQPEQKGNLKMVFAKTVKEANPDAYKSWASAWVSDHSDAPLAPPAPPAASAEEKEKKKRGRPAGFKMSEETKAKAAATRAAKKEGKSNAAAASAVPLPASPPPGVLVNEYEELEIDGESFFYDETRGFCFKNEDGEPGDYAGTFDGVDFHPC